MILAANNLASTGTNISVYQVANGKDATVNVRVVNRTSAVVKVRLAITESGSPTTKDYILFDYSILPGETYTETALVLATLNILYAQTDTSGVNVVVWGFEE